MKNAVNCRDVMSEHPFPCSDTVKEGSGGVTIKKSERAHVAGTLAAEE